MSNIGKPVSTVAEYKVRQVVRYIVTRFKHDGIVGSSTQFGEFDSMHAASNVAYALAGAEDGAIVNMRDADGPTPPADNQG